MSRRKSITKSIADRFKLIDGNTPYKTNLFNNSFDDLKFWDEVNDFPCIYVTPGSETREYHPADFIWGFLSVCVKIYTRGEDCQEQLEELIEDVERSLNTSKGVIQYSDENAQYKTAEISITSITTDEGLLKPYGVGEVYLQVRYQIINS